ncbi:MAG: DUF2076 domain-containing protein [Afipia sp.]|nr:DUF2076 domain-containing protein [Afipia sp.]
MTPQERQLVDDLFDRLARLETSPREPDADAAIAQGLRRAPNAVYALVQTVLVQDEALRRADARIQELEGGAEQQQPSGGFLDSMRDAILGPGQGRGSVPSVRPGDGSQRGPVWNSGEALGQADARMGDPRMNAGPRMNDSRLNDPRSGNPGGGLFGGGNAGGGGSFLGTAAATAAGVIGGSMLMNSIRGMMGSGSGQQQSLGNTAESGGSKMPWDNSNQSSGNLARDAGVNDVGKSGSGDSQRQSSYDQAQADTDQGHDDDDDYGDDDVDDGDSDFA